jgi:metal-dependent amidase/aminoacylase/carboxypeptidase family protein
MSVVGTTSASATLDVLGDAANAGTLEVLGQFGEFGVGRTLLDSGSFALGGYLDFATGMEVNGTGTFALHRGNVLASDATFALDAGATVPGNGNIGVGLSALR